MNLLVSGRVSFHPKVLMVEQTLLCPSMNQVVVAKNYPYPLVDSVAVGETLLYPLVSVSKVAPLPSDLRRSARGA